MAQLYFQHKPKPVLMKIQSFQQVLDICKISGKLHKMIQPLSVNVPHLENFTDSTCLLWKLLPKDVIFLILMELDALSFSNFGATCRLAKSITEDPNLEPLYWKSQLESQFANDISKRFLEMIQLSTIGSQIPDKEMFKIAFRGSQYFIPHFRESDLVISEKVSNFFKKTTVFPVKFPQLFTRFRRMEVLIVVGPPGCGKKTVIEAFANTVGALVFRLDMERLTFKSHLGT